MMIQSYQDFEDRITGAINSRDWKFSSRILGIELEEEQEKSKLIKECEVQILGSGITPLVKDDILIFFIISMLRGE